MLIQRQVSSIVQSALNRQAAVALIGPRQVGKTTLARMIGEPRNALYLDSDQVRCRIASTATCPSDRHHAQTPIGLHNRREKAFARSPCAW